MSKFITPTFFQETRIVIAGAVQSLCRQRSRSLVTIVAIAIGIASAITIMAAGRGIERFILGQLDIYGADTLYVEVKVPNDKTGGGPGSVGITITTLKNKDIEAIRNYPNISAAYGMVMGQEAVSYGGQIKKVMLMGNGAQMDQIEKFTLQSGRFFSEDEDAGLATVAVLGSKAKDKLFGEEDAVGKTMYIRGRPFRVIGVMDPRGAAFFLDMDNMIILPTKTMQKRLLGIDYVGSIEAKMKNPGATMATVADIEALLRNNHSIADAGKDDFHVHSMAEAQQTVGTVASGITFLLVGLVCISLVVGGVGIMNIMYVSVAERIFEIGLRKALGAQRRDILWQFLSEAVLLTTSGGVAGVALGALLALFIYWLATSAGFKWVYAVPLNAIILSVGFSAAIGILFGWYPAQKASKLDPIEALRKE